MKRALAVLAATLILVLSVSAVPQVLQWGQHSIRPAGSYVTQSADESNSFGVPEFLPIDLLGGETVVDIRSGPYGALLYRTSIGNYWVSGLAFSGDSGHTPKYYYPKKLNFSETLVDPINGAYKIVGFDFVSDPEEQSEPSTLDSLAMLIQSRSDPSTYAMIKPEAFNYEEPETFTLYNSEDGSNATDLICARSSCVLLVSGQPFIAGYFNSESTEPVLGPDTTEATVLQPGLHPQQIAWTSSCGISYPLGLTDIHLGSRHALAVHPGSLTSSGYQEILLWGDNNQYQLGSDSEGDHCSILVGSSTSFPGLAAGTNISQIAVGQLHNIILFSNGAVYTWGDNSRGQLGSSPSTVDPSLLDTLKAFTPTMPIFPQISGVNPTITFVGAFGFSSFAADSLGNVYAWGSNAAPLAYEPAYVSTSFDGGIGVLGLGASRPSLPFVTQPIIMPLSLPTGSHVTKIIPPFYYRSAYQLIAGNQGDHIINFIVDVPAPVSYSAPLTANNPYRNPVAIGDTALVTWGTWSLPGVAHFVETRAIPRPIIVDMDRKINISAIGDITTSQNMIYVQNAQNNSFWFFGNNDGRLPSGGLASYIQTPVNSMNTSEAFNTLETSTTLVTDTSAMFVHSDASSFKCVLLAGRSTPFTFSTLSAGDAFSPLPVRRWRNGASHIIIEHVSNTIETCTANCQSSPGDTPWLGRTSTDACGLIEITDYRPTVLLSAAGDGVTVIWACNEALDQCVLSTFGERLLGRSTGVIGQQNLVDVSSLSFLAGTVPAARVKSIECGSAYCLLHLGDGSVAGWGNLTVSTTSGPQEFTAPIVLVYPTQWVSESIVQVSVIDQATFILTNAGKIYTFGAARSSAFGFLDTMPFLVPQLTIGSSELRYMSELQIINDVYYFYTKLMNSSSLSDDTLAPFAALGRASVPPPITPPVPIQLDTPVPFVGTKKRSLENSGNFHTRESLSDDLYMVAWGDNMAELSDTYPNRAGTIQLLGVEDPNPFIKVPTKMFPSARTTSDAFPFDLMNASFSFGSQHAYALTPEGDVYYWGETAYDRVHPNAPFYSAATGGAKLLMTGVSKMQALPNGVMFIDSNGNLTCSIPSSADAGSCYSYYGGYQSDTGALLIYDWLNPQYPLDPPVTAPFTDLVCSIYNECLMLADDNIYAYPSTQQISSSPVYYGSANVSRIWIAGPNTRQIMYNIQNDPTYHYLYSESVTQPDNSVTWVKQYGWSNPATYAAKKDSLLSNFNIYPVGLLDSEVSKIAAGTMHILALLTNGSIAGWSWSPYGELGFYSHESIPVAVMVHENIFGPRGSISIVDIGASGYTSYALASNGDLYYWGADLQDRSVPIYTNYSAFYTEQPALRSLLGLPSRALPTLLSAGTGIKRLISSQSYVGSANVAPQVRGFAVSGTPPAPIASPVAPVAAPPSNQCPPPKPNPRASCIIYQSKFQWVITQASINGTLTISNNVVIVGNFTVSSETPVIIRSLGGGELPLINVTGFANLTAPIVVELDDEDVKAISRKEGSQTSTTTVLEASTLSLSTSPSSAVKVNSSAKKCRKVSSKTSQIETGGRSGLATLVSVNSGSCNNWWIILVSVICGVILLVLIFLIVYFSSPKVQGVFRPYKDAN